MITSFVWAQIASRHGSAAQIPVDGGRYVRSTERRKGSFVQSLIHAFWFLTISAGIAFFAIVPILYVELSGVELVYADGLIQASSVFHGRMLDTLVGAVVVGVGVTSFIWSFSVPQKGNRDPYDRDERLQ